MPRRVDEASNDNVSLFNRVSPNMKDKQMKQIAVIGSVVIDLAVQTPRLPTRGETLLANNFKIGPGGKGANAAVAVQRAGAAAVLLGCIGDDEFGRMEMAALREEGVDVDAVTIHPEASTGVGIAMIDADGENTILGVLGANDYLSSDNVTQVVALHQDTLDGILVNFEVPEPAVAAAVQLGVDYGIPVIVDAGPARPYAPETWRNCTILTPNKQETETLVGYPVSDDATAERAARELLRIGPSAVVLHRGARGALLVTSDDTIHIPSFSVDVVDTTGAGDAFSGTLSVAMAEGLPLVDATRRANAAGALAVTRLGTLPIMPTRQEVDTFLKHQSEEKTG